MKEETMRKWARIAMVLCAAAGVLSLVIFIPQVREMIIGIGERMVGRPLTHEVWHRRFLNFASPFSKVMLYLAMALFLAQLNRKLRIRDFCCFVVIQLMLLASFGHSKRTFMCDEICSYGLANSENYAFLDYNSSRQASESGWVREDFFRDYVAVSEGTGLSLRAPFENQKKDVHPPFYYILLHIVCFVFKGSFTKWTGLLLNFLIVIGLDALLFYIYLFLLKDDRKSMLALFLWACSAAGLSNILFIRMYLLQTLEIAAYMALHIYLYKRRRGLSAWSCVALGCLVAASGLTHYYFYPFAFFFSCPILFYFLLTRQFKRGFAYALSLLAGFCAALLIFPATLRHVFKGYRGTEVLRNISERGEQVFQTYMKWMSSGSCGGLLRLILCLAAAIFIVRMILRHFLFIERDGRVIKIRARKPACAGISFSITDKVIALCPMLLSLAAFMFFAIQGSQLKSNRYIYPVYPAISLLIVCAVSYILPALRVPEKLVTATLCVCVLGMSALSVRNYKIDFQYPTYDKLGAEKAALCRGYDCLIFLPGRWVDVYTALPLQFNYDESFFLKESDIKNLPDILSRRQSENPVVVRLPEFLSAKEKSDVLEKVKSAAGFRSHKMMYKYYTEAYLLE